MPMTWMRSPGLTTGAGMWLASGVGLACGLGFWQIALFASVLVLIVLGIMQQLQPSFASNSKDTDGAKREQKSTQLPGSLGSQSDDGTASGSTRGRIGPRPSHQTQPSGRSTQRTSRVSMLLAEAFGAADRLRSRGHAADAATATRSSGQTGTIVLFAKATSV